MCERNLTLLEKSGPLCVQCDRCQRFLGKDGKPYPTDSPEIISFREQGSTAAVDVADRFACEHGWSIETACPEERDYGVVITCPECLAGKRRTVSTGKHP